MLKTQIVIVDDGALAQVPRVSAKCFPGRTPMLVADDNTWAAAGRAVMAMLPDAADPLILPAEPELAAEMGNVERVQAALEGRDVTPIAVGSGTINDLVKLAAGRLGRDYLAVGTAASMDGYTAFGASITEAGNKQTFDCPAPRAFVADLAVLAAAPKSMAANGYADLLAKVTAGADWILADALGVEPINAEAWAIIQTPLRGWLADPAGVARHDKAALKDLMDGLVAGGLAMQVTQNSRPASGAEHQFSHLWDMQGHTHHGHHVPHGAKVAIGTLASATLYERLFQEPIERLDVRSIVDRWPPADVMRELVTELHGVPAVREKALEESTAKYVSREALQSRLEQLRDNWPDIRRRLHDQLIPHMELVRMLATAGAPTESEQIGISAERLADSHAQARSIRRRYTVLDLAYEIALV